MNGYKIHSCCSNQYFQAPSPVTVPECGAQSLQSSNVSREFENPENPENPKDLRRLGKVLQGVVRVEVVEEEGDVEGEDAEKVDHVQKSDREKELEIFLVMGGLVKSPCEEPR